MVNIYSIYSILKPVLNVFILECLALFLIGEGKLESYLDENPPIDVNTIKARSGLAEPKRHLQRTIEEDGKQVNSFLLLLVQINLR